jgi:hypothetical protein
MTVLLAGGPISGARVSGSCNLRGRAGVRPQGSPVTVTPLWEPGDEAGASPTAASSPNTHLSTVHSPYYCCDLDIQLEEKK